jgi:hypothetical protein
LPLFESYWEGVPADREASLFAALDLAERSAAEGRSLASLEDAATQATIVAGAALQGIYRFRNDEKAPTDRHAAETASSVAKAVEWAAKAAAAAPGESAQPTLEAFAFAHDAAHAAEDVEIVEGLHHDLDRLCRVAHRGRWRAQTPVPPAVFTLLSEVPNDPKPWWKIW